MNSKIWNWSTISKFNEKTYKGIINENQIVSNRTPINIGTKDEPDKRIVYIFKKGLKEYALPYDHVEELPLIPTNTIGVTYGRHHYDYILSYNSARFKPEKKMSFKELIDTFCPFKHSNPTNFLVTKIMVVTAVVERINVRLSSEPGYGKDSLIRVLSDLLGNVTVVSNPTIAKMEYSLRNEVVMLNEVSDLNAQEKNHIQQFLLNCGDFSNKYVKRSRDMTGSVGEERDISNLSLLVAFNNLDCYPNKDKYFDYMFQQAVRERFLPLKMKGVLTEKFERIQKPVLIVDEYGSWLKDWIRTLLYYKNDHRELGGTPSYKVPGLVDRQKKSFDTISDYFWLYCEGDKELFSSLVKELNNCFQDYQRMVKGDNGLLSFDGVGDVELVDLSDSVTEVIGE